MMLASGANLTLSCLEAQRGNGNPSFETSGGSLCMYDFGVIYLLEDHKQALSNSLQSFLDVAGSLPIVPDTEYRGHRSLVSNAICKSLADLPETDSLITGMHEQGVSGLGIELDDDEDMYMCPSCHHTFKSAAQLKAHRHLHEGEKPFSCTLCHVSFSNKSQLLGKLI
jgi:hypothetical protein